MNITTLLAQQIIDVHAGDNWTEVNIENTLKNIYWEEAVTVTPASPNCIAALLHHLTYWNRVMAKRLQGIKVEIPESNGFDFPLLTSDADWQELQQDNLASATELAGIIQNVNPTKLNEPILPGYPSVYKNIQGSAEHIHYHLGQMVILKKLLKSGNIYIVANF